MKVALVSFHSFYHPGGVKRHIFGLAKEFRNKGIECKIIAPRRKMSENYGKNVILLGTSIPVNVAGTETDLVVNFFPLSVEKILKKENFDVLHFHNFTPPSAFQILERSRSLNVLTIHANLEKSDFLKKTGFLYICRKIVLWKIDGLIGVASLNLKDSEEFKGPKEVIPNGIDLEEFNPGVPGLKEFSDGKINILYLGRIEERKGLIYLLQAYKILEKKLGSEWVLSNLRLIIVGEGPLKEDMEKWARINGLKNVVFTGKAPENETASYYKSCDIYCSPAIFGESFGLVLIEAMACGKPVVAFANEGYRGVLEKTKGGRFLAKPKDYKTLAEKLENLIKNKKLRKEMGQWGIKESKKYSWKKVAGRILDFYGLCRQYKQKREEKEGFSLEKKIDKMFNEIF